MTVGRLRKLIAQFDNKLEVQVLHTDGVQSDVECVVAKTDVNGNYVKVYIAEQRYGTG